VRYALGALLLSASCATMQMREIESVRGAREPAEEWSREEQRELERLVRAGRVVAVDIEGAIVPDCGAGARYLERAGEIELVEVETPIVAGACERATDIISGFTRAESGTLLAVSYAQIEQTAQGPSLALLVTKTTIESGDVEGRWTLQDSDGAPLCELPCARYFMPHPDLRAGSVVRADDEHSTKIPWDPLHPGTEVELELKIARPVGTWPAIPITQILVGFGGAATATGLIARGDIFGSRSAKEAIAGPILTVALAIVGVALGGHGIYWLASPPEREPLLLRASSR
jgi:hypothetical protein